MAKFTVQGTGQIVQLDKGNFKAQGGEGAIHIVDKTVYKVCDAGKMIPEGKFQELAALSHPKIVNPENILLDSRQKKVGYTMRLVPDSIPLAQIVTKTYREREGVTPDVMSELVRQIADGIRYIHSKPGYLQVDGNEYNYMVTKDHTNAYFIDVNSFQTPSYPADAIMPSIRDYNCPTNAAGYPLWSHESDWYSFAIISFLLFTAIHPFKGRHPKFTNVKTLMVDQMTAGISVLDPESKFPMGTVYFPFEDFVPGGKSGAYMSWYRAIFCEGKRLPAPETFQAIAKFAAKIQQIAGSNNFTITELRDFAAQIVGYYSKGGNEVTVTKSSIFVGNQPSTRPADRFRVCFTPVKSTPIAAWVDKGRLQLSNLHTGKPISFDLVARNITFSDGRLYVQSFSHIYEIMFFEKGDVITPMTHVVANIMPEATELFHGVAVQDMMGARYVSAFPESRQHRQIAIKELLGRRILDAKFDRNVLMTVSLDETTGEYDRHVFRFDATWDSYDVRVAPNIVPNGLNFTVLDNGTCVCITETEELEIFSNQMNSSGLKSFTDPVIKGDMRLCHHGSQVRFAHGQKLYSISVRKT